MRIGRPCIGLDLSAGDEAARSTPRAAAAAERARAGISPYASTDAPIETHASEPWLDPTCHTVVLDEGSGTLSYQQGHGEPRSLTPMSDGLPALKGSQIASTQQGGDVLTVQIETRSALNLWFISKSRSAVLGTFSYDFDGPATGWFALSQDGRRFARRVGQDRLEIRDVPGDWPPVMFTARERAVESACLAGPIVPPGARVRPGRRPPAAWAGLHPVGRRSTHGRPR